MKPTFKQQVVAEMKRVSEIVGKYYPDEPHVGDAMAQGFRLGVNYCAIHVARTAVNLASVPHKAKRAKKAK